MADIKIDLDANDLAKKVTDALATTLVGQMVSGFLTNRIINEEHLGREYDRAVEEVAHHAFVEYLKSDPAFQKKLKAMISTTADEQYLKQFVEKMKRHMLW